jgi:hypothetical protein
VEWLKRMLMAFSRVGAWMPQGRTSARKTCPITADEKVRDLGGSEDLSGYGVMQHKSRDPNGQTVRAVAFKSHQTQN